MPWYAAAVGFVERHAAVALASIVVLVGLAIGLVVYYRGAGFFGPYWKPRPAEGMKGGKPRGPDPAPPGPKPGEDAETERLINSINAGTG